MLELNPSNPVLVRNSDVVVEQLLVHPNGRWERQVKTEDGRCHGFGQIWACGLVTAIYAIGRTVILQHGARRWDLATLQVTVRALNETQRIATLLADDGETESIPYIITSDMAEIRRIDPTWDGLDEEFNDCFVFLQYTNSPEWRSRLPEIWGPGI